MQYIIFVMGICASIDLNSINDSDVIFNMKFKFYFLELPEEMHLHICSFMTQSSLINFNSVSHYCHQCVKSLPREAITTVEEMERAVLEKRFMDINFSNCPKSIKYGVYRKFIKEGKIQLPPFYQMKQIPYSLKEATINACEVGDIDFLKLPLPKMNDTNMYTVCLDGLLCSVEQIDLFLEAEKKLRYLYKGDLDFRTNIAMRFIIDTCVNCYIENIKKNKTVYFPGFVLIDNLNKEVHPPNRFYKWYLEKGIEINKEYEEEFPFYRIIAAALNLQIPNHHIVNWILRNAKGYNSWISWKNIGNSKIINTLVINSMTTIDFFRNGLSALVCDELDIEDVSKLLKKAKNSVKRLSYLLNYKDSLAPKFIPNVNIICEFKIEMILIIVKSLSKNMNLIFAIICELCQKEFFDKATKVWETTTLFIDPCKVIAFISVPSKATISYLIEKGGNMDGARAYISAEKVKKI